MLAVFALAGSGLVVAAEPSPRPQPGAIAVTSTSTATPLDEVGERLRVRLETCTGQLRKDDATMAALRRQLGEEKEGRARAELRTLQAPPPAPEPRSRWLDVLDVALPVGGAAVGAGGAVGACELAACPGVTAALVGAAGGALGALVGWAVSPR